MVAVHVAALNIDQAEQLGLLHDSYPCATFWSMRRNCSAVGVKSSAPLGSSLFSPPLLKACPVLSIYVCRIALRIALRIV